MDNPKIGQRWLCNCNGKAVAEVVHQNDYTTYMKVLYWITEKFPFKINFEMHESKNLSRQYWSYLPNQSRQKIND